MNKADFTPGGLWSYFAKPQRGTVDAIVHGNFYSQVYPVTREELDDILDRGNTLNDKIFGYLNTTMVLDHLTELYTLAAGWLKEPRLVHLLKDGQPCYPHLAP